MQGAEPKALLFSSGNIVFVDRTTMSATADTLSEEDQKLVDEEKDRITKLLTSFGKELNNISQGMHQAQLDKEEIMERVEKLKSDMENIDVGQLREHKRNVELVRQKLRKELHETKIKNMGFLGEYKLKWSKYQKKIITSNVGRILHGICSIISDVMEVVLPFIGTVICLLFFVHFFLPIDISGMCQEMKANNNTLPSLKKFNITSENTGYLANKLCDSIKYKVHNYEITEDVITLPPPFVLVLEYLQCTPHCGLFFEGHFIEQLIIAKSYEFVKRIETLPDDDIHKSLIPVGLALIHVWAFLCGVTLLFGEILVISYQMFKGIVELFLSFILQTPVKS